MSKGSFEIPSPALSPEAERALMYLFLPFLSIHSDIWSPITSGQERWIPAVARLVKAKAELGQLVQPCAPVWRSLISLARTLVRRPPGLLR